MENNNSNLQHPLNTITSSVEQTTNNNKQENNIDNFYLYDVEDNIGVKKNIFNENMKEYIRFLNNEYEKFEKESSDILLNIEKLLEDIYKGLDLEKSTYSSFPFKNAKSFYVESGIYKFADIIKSEIFNLLGVIEQRLYALIEKYSKDKKYLSSNALTYYRGQSDWLIDECMVNILKAMREIEKELQIFLDKISKTKKEDSKAIRKLINEVFFKVNNIINKKFKINEILEDINIMQKACRDYVDSVSYGIAQRKRTSEEGKDEEF